MIVRNTFHTVRIPWQDVDAFVANSWLRGTPYEVGAVRRRGGGIVRSIGLTPPFGDRAPWSR